MATHKACSVPGCESKGWRMYPKLSFHRYPHQEARRTEWIRRINPSLWLLDKKRLDLLRVCSRHFSKEKYLNVPRKTLVTGAVPDTALPSMSKEECAVMGEEPQRSATKQEPSCAAAQVCLAHVKQECPDEDEDSEVRQGCPGDSWLRQDPLAADGDHVNIKEECDDGTYIDESCQHTSTMDQAALVCEVCTKSCTQQEVLKRHSSVFATNKMTFLLVSQFDVPSGALLERHLQLHPSLYKCGVCRQVFVELAHLQKHRCRRL